MSNEGQKPIEASPEHAKVIDAFRNQILLILLSRLGPNVVIPIEEVDSTGGKMVLMKVVDGAFHFEVQDKPS